MNPVLIGAKLNLKRNSLKTLEEQLNGVLKKREELVGTIEAVETEEDLEAVEQQANELEEEIKELEEEKAKIEKQIEELEGQLKEQNRKSPKIKGKGEERNMTKTIEVREGINAYVRSKGQVREGFTSVDGGALIPEEVLAPQKEPQDTVDLSKLVNVRPVNSGSGKYPVVKKSGSRMVSQAELAKNPELAKPQIENVPYDIETYRGHIPVSQEVIEDADYDVTELIAEEINDQELNTKNAEIAAVLKTAPAKTVEDLDGLKAVFNKDIKRVYNAKAIISSSLFNELDTMKDANGRYLLQDDITVESGKKLFGKEVVVLDDDMIGEADGDMVGFIGDPKAFVTLFDRKRASVKWVDNEVYGQVLASFVRFDVQATDTDAGFYVTFSPVAGA